MVTSQSDLPTPETATARYGSVGSALQFLVIASFTLLLPSGIARVDRAKLALLSTLTATFFLFAAKTWFPDGAAQFMQYAEAIVHGTTLSPDLAQRDAGYPLLIVLSGYPFLHSFIPLFLIQAGFAILLPLLAYEGLRRLSPTTAFYTGLASIVTLSPFYFMKMIHHDQIYIFFSMLMLCQLLIFVQTKKMRFLYFFTIAAICASVARPSGNALFPLFVIVGYTAARGNVLHYFACSIVFAAFVAGYAWHRHVIFDAEHAQEMPSYVGEQFFYNPYLNTFDYGIRLSPNDVGPNLSHAIDELRRRLQPNPKDSEFIRTQYDGPPYQTEFAEAHIDPFTADELIEQVLVSPNSEYYTLLCAANEDRVLLAAALEIARAYPGLILRYSVRNLIHFVFSPGYKHSRYNLNPFRPEGLVFYPAYGDVSSQVEALPAQSVREVNFDPVRHEPFIVHRLFSAIQTAWLKAYTTDAAIIAWLMCVAWGTAAVGLVQAVRSPPRPVSAVESNLGRVVVFDNALVASIVIGSLVFGYNAAVTSVFAEPDFRYRQIADLQAILIAGLGLISMQHWIMIILGDRLTAYNANYWDRAIRTIRARDIWRRLTAFRLATIVLSTAFCGLAGWTLFMIENT
jgi:hypothetical protein